MEEQSFLAEDRLRALSVPGRVPLDADLRVELERAAELLLRADREIALVSRAAPLEMRPPGARTRVRAGAAPRDARSLVGRVDLSGTRRILLGIARTTEPFGVLGRLHAERALELELEARMVEALGGPLLRALAAERFPVPRAARARACDAFVAAALAERSDPSERAHRSDDTADPASLVALVSRRARELGLSIRVEVRAEQLATAATGEGIVAVRRGVFLSTAQAERIAAHELLGHALPRARALHAPLRLLRAGTARSGDHEEGRALLVERRAGLFDAERRRELALRHRAALAVRDHAEPEDTLSLLTALGAPRDAAFDMARRAHRGGGLARELVYLPAYFAVTEAFAENPLLEGWFERGRLDLEAARLFADGAAQVERRESAKLE